MNYATAQAELQTRLQALPALAGISVLIDDPEEVSSTFEADWERALSEQGIVLAVGADLSAGTTRASVMGETVFDAAFPVYVVQNTRVRLEAMPSTTFGGICDAVISGFIASDDVEVVDISALSETDGGSLMRVIFLQAALHYPHSD